ncbi:MAG: hypothetical protein K6E54_05495 [Bacteroidaceae bacterium]|nr:hypothetical protein [Bacteroidaceae bacterium]
MSFFSNIFKKKEKNNVGGMEDFMTLIRVYFQSVLASNFGITNLAMLPDMAAFKRSLHVATLNNKLGLGEKKACSKMLIDIYGLNEEFFQEIDKSIKKNCKNPNDIRNYMIAFQGFSQEIIMLMSNRLNLKMRIPNFLGGLLKRVTNNEVHEVLTNNNWSDDNTRRSAASIKRYQQMLGFSEKWIQNYVYNIIILAKKEPKPSDEELQKAEQKLKK